MARAGSAALRPIAAMAIAGLAVASLAPAAALADTLEWALVQAYPDAIPGEHEKLFI